LRFDDLLCRCRRPVVSYIVARSLPLFAACCGLLLPAFVPAALVAAAVWTTPTVVHRLCGSSHSALLLLLLLLLLLVEACERVSGAIVDGPFLS
jgi:hypothetical protein